MRSRALRRRYGRAAARATRPDGRLIPEAGDKVFQTVPGAFGMAAVIHGVVFKGRGGLRVKVTGGESLLGIGAAPTGKTYRLDGNWTVEDDPFLAAREAERETRARESAAARETKKVWEASAVAEEAARLGLRKVTGIGDVAVGDTVYSLEPDASGNVSAETVTVTGIEDSLRHPTFLHKTSEGYEVTAGHPELWWKRA